MLARLLALFLLLLASPAVAETIVVHAGRLIADPSRPASGPSTITIVDGRIRSVTSGLEPAPAGARLIDLSNRTVLPGLIDAHVHLSGNPSGEFWREAVDPDGPGNVFEGGDEPPAEPDATARRADPHPFQLGDLLVDERHPAAPDRRTTAAGEQERAPRRVQVDGGLLEHASGVEAGREAPVELVGETQWAGG